MDLKEMEKVIKYDLNMLYDFSQDSENWRYSYKLLKGNITDLFKYLLKKETR